MVFLVPQVKTTQPTNSISNIILNMGPVTTAITAIITPPMKAVGDQHRPHLNTLLEEFITLNRLRLMPSIKLRFLPTII
jgi:hypothetical protein